MITKRGKPLGVFTKQPNYRIRTPDFLRNLKKLGHSKKLGDEILKEFMAPCLMVRDLVTDAELP
jgi:hypothetical protein